MPTVDVNDVNTPWQAKLRRAQKHLDELSVQLKAYLDSKPWEVTKSPGRDDNEVAYWLEVHRALPTDTLTIAGDAVHNLRSALDSLAYALADGTDKADGWEKATGFPLVGTPKEFAEYFDARGRRRIHSPLAIEALRAPADFWIYRDVSSPEDMARMWHFSPFRALAELSNIDKHRHLPVTTCSRRMTYWGSNEGDPKLQWSGPAVTVVRGAGRELLGYLSGPDADHVRATVVMHDIQVGFDGTHPDSAIDAELKSWHGRVSWAIWLVCQYYNSPPADGGATDAK